MDEEEIQGQLLTQLVSIQLIVRALGKYLSLPDLISCSEVSTTWCTKFREYVQTERKCSIKIRWLDQPCLQLIRLNELLTHSAFVLPYNSYYCPEWDRCRVLFDSQCVGGSHENITPESYDVILSKVRFTRFVIFWPCLFPQEINCPAIRWMEKTMRLKAGFFKTLTLQQSLYVDSLLDYFNVDPEIRPHWLANVRTFNNGGFYDRRSCCLSTKHLQEILQSSPNLREINGKLPSEMFEETCSSSEYSGIVPSNKYRCITDAYGLNVHQLSRLAKERPQLKHIGFFSQDDDPKLKVFEGRTNTLMGLEALNLLFRSSHSSLQSLRCNVFELAIILRKLNGSISPLIGVSRMELLTNFEEISYFQYMNLQPMFPNLTIIHLEPIKSIRNLDSHLLSFQSCFDYNESTVKDLHLYHYVPGEYLQVVKLAFPNLTHFTYHDCRGIQEMCEALWTMKWEKMRKIRFCSVQINFDIDSLFYGLPKEEREFIESQKLDPEKLHYVGSSYSAFSFQNLDTVQLELEECPSYTPNYDAYKQPQKLPIVSEITAHWITQRLPGLVMEIKMEPEYVDPGVAISHDKYSKLLQQSGLEGNNCSHKRLRSHRPDHNLLKKIVFKLVFRKGHDFNVR